MGEITFGALVAGYGGAAAVLEAARADRLAGAAARPEGNGIRAAVRLRADVRERIAEAARDPARVHERIRELGLWTATPLDADFPSRLRVLDPPPRVIFGWGAKAALSARRSVAVVGTRRPTLHGRAAAASIAGRLATFGATIVSGLAIGIDGAAQAATVEHDGQTIGVLGSGHASAGPRAHRELIRRIRERGAVISELAPHVVPTRGTFPRRNRIISALGDAVIVVEAPMRSGALITARHALEQGRDLFVVPGRLDDRASAGCLALLRETPARVVTGMDELVVDLGLNDAEQAPARAERPGPLHRGDAISLLAAAERAIALAICEAPGGLDSLVSRTGLGPGAVAGAVTLLQIRGWIQTSGAAFLPAGPLLVEH